ncbi:helix-turn-helix transcriptional regulator [Ulvibacterium sp.]|uniref:helix-turn-helix transcriptional regulator n=1 Tax=Ulvibacterium sp. TaxID=2665914 RepID=UPI00263120BD|nr:AraC family transcriptional regulator [Ulvibacterium sp.]
MNVYDLHKANPDIFKQFSIKDVLFLYYHCPQKEKILKLHSPYNQLTFSISGRRIFHQGEHTYTVNKNSGFLLRRAAFLQEMDDTIKGWELMAFYLKDEFLKKIFNEFRPHLPLRDLPPQTNEMVIPMDINDRIRSCYLSLIPYFNQSDSLPQEILLIKLKELLYNVFINPKNRILLSYVNSLANGYKTPIWEIMEANYMYNLKLSDYAQLANKSLSSFKREFEEFYGTTPGKWILEKRLERAKRLIQTSQKTVSEITFECGFKNVSHFSRIFKEKFSLSPTEYRGNN